MHHVRSRRRRVAGCRRRHQAHPVSPADDQAEREPAARPGAVRDPQPFRHDESGGAVAVELPAQVREQRDGAAGVGRRGLRQQLAHARREQLPHEPLHSDEASIVKIGSDGITVVGKGKWGMLYGVQTVNQLVRGYRLLKGRGSLRPPSHPLQGRSLPCLIIKDWPDMKWRCLSPTMTWYSGYNRLEGYDLCNWTLDEWKWLVDWSLLHKCNGWAMCMYGNWPFTLPGYEETTLDVDSFFYDPETGKKDALAVHPPEHQEGVPARADPLCERAGSEDLRLHRQEHASTAPTASSTRMPTRAGPRS